MKMGFKLEIKNIFSAHLFINYEKEIIENETGTIPLIIYDLRKNDSSIPTSKVIDVAVGLFN